MGCGAQTKEYIKSKIIMLKVDQILIAERKEECLKKYEQMTGQKYVDEGECIDSSRTNEGKGQDKDKEEDKKEKEKRDIETHETKPQSSCKSSRKQSQKIDEIRTQLITNNPILLLPNNRPNKIIPIQLKNHTISLRSDHND